MYQTRSCIFVLGLSISAIFLLDFRTVRTMWDVLGLGVLLFNDNRFNLHDTEVVICIILHNVVLLKRVDGLNHYLSIRYKY
jgi:hypothetical protein